jgi:hypothetical protein
MKKNIRLTESDLHRIVKKIIKEQTDTCITPATSANLLKYHEVMKKMGYSCSNGDRENINYYKVIKNGELSLTVSTDGALYNIKYNSETFSIRGKKQLTFNADTLKRIESVIQSGIVTFEP